MFVKPAANPAFDEKADESRANPRQLFIFDPALSDYLPSYGRDVGGDNGLYWHRLILNGDAVELSAEEGNAALEAEAGRLKAEKAKADAEMEAEAKRVLADAAASKKPAAPAASKEGK